MKRSGVLGGAVTKPRPRFPSETKLVAACINLLRLNGYLSVRINQQGVPLHDGSGKMRKGPTRGVSDIQFGKGRIWGYIECKRGAAQLTLQQRDFIGRVRSVGGYGLVIRDVAELDVILKQWARAGTAGQ